MAGIAVIDFCLRVGLPVTLSDIGVEADADTLAPVAEAACAEGETIYIEPVLSESPATCA